MTDVLLYVLNIDDSAGELWALNCDSINCTISRNPVVVSVPTGRQHDESIYSNRPSILTLDFGMLTETVTISGVISDNTPAQDPSIPSIGKLAEIARCSWANVEQSFSDEGLSMNGGLALFIDPGPGQGGSIAPGAGNTPGFWYQGVVAGFTYSRQGGMPRWEYKLTMQVGVFEKDMVMPK